jgi:acyl dehydratase
VNSCFTLALVTGQSVIDLTMNGVANLGWEDVKLPNPSSRATRSMRRARCSRRANRKSRPKVGIVRVKTTGVNQNGTPVIEFNRTFMIWKRGYVPKRRG